MYYKTYCFVFQKRLFCNVKPMLLPCKTAAFNEQNNRFYNALTIRELSSNYAYERYLHLYHFLLAKNNVL